MDRDRLISTLLDIRSKYTAEGFILLGYFGSYARGTENAHSDLDILYELTPRAFEKYPGFRFMELYGKVKNDLETALHCTVDLADKNALTETGRKYILPEVRYVA